MVFQSKNKQNMENRTKDFQKEHSVYIQVNSIFLMLHPSFLQYYRIIYD